MVKILDSLGLYEIKSALAKVLENAGYSKVNNNQENLIDIFSNYPPKEWEYQIKNLLVYDLKPYDFGSLLEEIL